MAVAYTDHPVKKQDSKKGSDKDAKKESEKDTKK